MKGLVITDLSVSVDDRTIIDHLSLSFSDQQVYALTGRNGSGKSTLLNAIMGAPGYQITSGSITLDGNNITNLPTDQRAKLGLFLAMQYPAEITGVIYADFLKTALTRLHDHAPDMQSTLHDLQRHAKALNFIDFDYGREVNVGFSGGEKKKSEILQMLAIKPRFAFLDEPDSGLDTASLHRLANCLNNLDYPTSLIIVSHNRRLLNSLRPLVIYDMEKLQ